MSRTQPAHNFAVRVSRAPVRLLAFANGEVFRAARRGEFLGVLAHVGTPAVAFVELMAPLCKSGALYGGKLEAVCLTRILRFLVRVTWRWRWGDPRPVGRGLPTAMAFQWLLNTRHGGAYQRCGRAHLTHAWPRASSAAEEDRLDARGGGRDQPSAGEGVRAR